MRTEEFIVETSLPSQRMDVYLKNRFPDQSRGTFQRLMEEGNLLVNDQPIRPTRHPRAGDRITISWPDPKPMEIQISRREFVFTPPPVIRNIRWLTHCFTTAKASLAVSEEYRDRVLFTDSTLIPAAFFWSPKMIAHINKLRPSSPSDPRKSITLRFSAEQDFLPKGK